MKRLALILAAVVAVVLVVVLVRSGGDRDGPPVAVAPIDTTPVSLDTLETNIPEALPDTFTPPKLPEVEPVRSRTIPAAPEALMDAVRREQAFTQFCYQEFGQKADPQLRGGVAVVVTVGSSGVTAARVANDSWTSSSGNAVNRCLNEKAGEAWRVPAGVVAPGQYVVALSFRPA